MIMATQRAFFDGLKEGRVDDNMPKSKRDNRMLSYMKSWAEC